MSFPYLEFGWNAHLNLLPAACLLKIHRKSFRPENGWIFYRLSDGWIKKLQPTILGNSVLALEYNRILV